MALLASTLPEPQRWALLNPASLKQVLTASARRLPLRSAFEQGAGLIDLLGAAQKLSEYLPQVGPAHAPSTLPSLHPSPHPSPPRRVQVSALPSKLDLSPCAHAGGYLWPLCSQPLFYGGMPLLLNITILNGMALHSNVSRPPAWRPFSAAGEYQTSHPCHIHHAANPTCHSADSSVLKLTFELPQLLSPWSGNLGIGVIVQREGAEFEGLVRGEISVEVDNLSGVFVDRRSEVVIPLTGATPCPTPRCLLPLPSLRSLRALQWPSSVPLPAAVAF